MFKNKNIKGVLLKLEEHIKKKNQNEVLLLMSTLTQLIRKNSKHEQFIVIHSTINKIFDSTILSIEQTRQALKYVIDICLIYKEYEKAIQYMSSCAQLFADIGVFQAAYRLLSDAEVLAKENMLIQSRAVAVETCGIVCLIEGDFNNADKYLHVAKKIYQKINMPLSIGLRSNIALVKHNKNEYAVASDIYNKLLQDISCQDDLSFSIKLNLAICYYRQGKGFEVQAEKLVIELIDSTEHINNGEQLIELYLFSTEVFLKKNSVMSLQLLNAAVKNVAILANESIKLQNRREVKERYIGRIRNLFVELDGGIDFELEAEILIFLKINSFSEWISVLDIAKSISKDVSIGVQLKQKLDSIICKLCEYGTPVLYGFREKYDDPFEDIIYMGKEIPSNNMLWLEFNTCIQEIYRDTGYQDIYQKASIEYILKHMVRQSTTDCFLFVIQANEEICIWYNIGKEWHVNRFELKRYMKFLNTLYEYQACMASKYDFKRVLNSTIKMLSMDMAPFLSEIHSEKKYCVHVVPDKILYSLPFMSVFIESDVIRQLILEEKFIVSFAPILFEKKKIDNINVSFAIIMKSEESLLMQDEEEKLLKKVSNNNMRHIDMENMDWKSNQLYDMNMLHISSHGFPIHFYTDPWYGQITNAGITIAEIQADAWKLPYSLVFINACNTANIAFKNYQKYFATNEIIGYSTAFMLNGKSDVIGADWPVMDLTAYVFATLFYQALVDNFCYKMAYNKAIAQLYDLDVSATVNILNQIQDEELRKQKLLMLERCSTANPFRDAYNYGCYRMTSFPFEPDVVQQ